MWNESLEQDWRINVHRTIRSAVVFIGFLGCFAHGETIFVNEDASGSRSGTSWSSAYTSIGAALERASAGDNVWVAKGTYGPLVLKEGVRILGGFAGTETEAAAANPRVHQTNISGRMTEQSVISRNHSSSTVLQGVYIVDGVASGWRESGGGAYLEHSNAMFVDCVFRNNKAFWAGGAVACARSSAPSFINCQFASNGGTGDETTIAGGAVFVHRSTPTFVNCLFRLNRAWEGGAVVNAAGGVPTMVNCTVVENEATRGKGGALFDDSVLAKIRNCIFWNNAAQKIDTNEIHNNRALGRTDTHHSNIAGGWPGTGNLNVDPMFVDAVNGNFSLSTGSPCLDRGDNAALPADAADLSRNGNRTETLPRDLALRGRIEGTAVDMGAFEAP